MPFLRGRGAAPLQTMLARAALLGAALLLLAPLP